MKDKPQELEDAICNVIQIIKQIPELADTRLAVVGDLALWHHLPTPRETNAVDLVTNLPTLKLLKGKLLEHPNSPFTYDTKGLLYHSPAGWAIPIQMVSKCLCPRLWEPEYVVRDMPYGQVPYLSVEGMVILKIESAHSKELSSEQRHQALEDAAALIDLKVAHETPTQPPAQVDDEAEASEKAVAGPSAPDSEKQKGFVKETVREIKPFIYKTVFVHTRTSKIVKCFHIQRLKVR
ncbi:hypothetical protein F5Y03DRAFT_406214 [Xylaria venustula]|nr:hypothetical protein F5Y03DRAFT_406214 [Xylaria venustula]